jgi:hypothetical protein
VNSCSLVRLPGRIGQLYETDRSEARILRRRHREIIKKGNVFSAEIAKSVEDGMNNNNDLTEARLKDWSLMRECG